MKTHFSSRTLIHPGTFALAALLLGGCLKERLAWSPNGRHAAILTAQGLYLSDATGKISPLLLPGAYLVAWLPDSERLVVARRKPARTFAEVSALLGPVRSRLLATKAERVWNRFRDLPRGEEFDQRFAAEVGEDLPGLLVYLREQPEHLAALREKLGADWKREDETKPIDLHEIVVVRPTSENLETGSTLFIGLPGIQALRPAPGGTAVAFTLPVELSLQPDNGICVMLAPLDASAPAAIVATQSSSHPAWSPDGRSLVFFKASGGAGQSDDLRLGTLVSRALLDASGRIQLATETTDLAGLIFHPHSRVSCLRDGRVLFNATPFSLPMIGNGNDGREQLFVVDRSGTAAVTPVIPEAQLDQLPKALSAFEVSPDESQVLIGSDSGEVWLLTLASGAAEQVTAKISGDKNRGEGENFPAPVWRTAGEFTFLRRAAPGTGASGTTPFELVLRRGSTDTVLSRNWDAALLRQLLE